MSNFKKSTKQDVLIQVLWSRTDHNQISIRLDLPYGFSQNDYTGFRAKVDTFDWVETSSLEISFNRLMERNWHTIMVEYLHDDVWTPIRFPAVVGLTYLNTDNASRTSIKARANSMPQSGGELPPMHHHIAVCQEVLPE